ncbi:hypothetical protein [Streptomyces sp. WG7]|uniref:hypothetical protein n=1 Tax=Streptomyces sp. WG7 TaxID=3417650 RepID=UPI003CE81F8E
MTGTDGGVPADRAGTEADMGAQHGEGGGHAGPRPVRHDTPGTERLLAAALRDEHVDAEGERRAVAAFRAALDAAPGRAARSRRRDDWRPRERRGAGRTLKTALSVLLASITLGGVAYAAIGGGGGSATNAAGPDPSRPPASTGGTEVRPVNTPRPGRTAPGATSAGPDSPAAPRDTEARCRAYERLEGRGEALDATAWQGLVAAAGDPGNVASYCAEQRAGQDRPSTPGTPETPNTPRTPGASGTPGTPATPRTPGDTNRPSGAAGPAQPGRSNGNAGDAANGNGDGGGTGSADRAPGKGQ